MVCASSGAGIGDATQLLYPQTALQTSHRISLTRPLFPPFSPIFPDFPGFFPFFPISHFPGFFVMLPFPCRPTAAGPHEKSTHPPGYNCCPHFGQERWYEGCRHERQAPRTDGSATAAEVQSVQIALAVTQDADHLFSRLIAPYTPSPPSLIFWAEGSLAGRSAELSPV